jgi:coatomer subunit beta
VKAAAKCYVELIVHESDNNVKLVVLDKLMKLQQDHKHDLALQVVSCRKLTILFKDFLFYS